MAPMWNDDESRRKAGRKHGNGNFMQGQDEMTLVPFHQVDDAEAEQCVEGKISRGCPKRGSSCWDVSSIHTEVGGNETC